MITGAFYDHPSSLIKVQISRIRLDFLLLFLFDGDLVYLEVKWCLSLENFFLSQVYFSIWSLKFFRIFFSFKFSFFLISLVHIKCTRYIVS